MHRAQPLTGRDVQLASYPDGDLRSSVYMVRAVSGWLADGRLRYCETVVDGLERAPEALARMLAGDTVGKTLVRIA